MFWYNYYYLGFYFLILLIIIIPLMCNFLFILTCPWSLCSPWQAGHYSNQMSTSLHHSSTPALHTTRHHSSNIIIEPLTGVSKACWHAAMRGGQMTIILSMSNVDSIGQPDCDLIIMDMSWPDYCLLACSYCELVCPVFSLRTVPVMYGVVSRGLQQHWPNTLSSCKLCNLYSEQNIPFGDQQAVPGCINVWWWERGLSWQFGSGSVTPTTGGASH